MSDYQPTMTLYDLYEDWQTSNMRVRKEETRHLMRISVQHFETFLDRPATLADFTEANLAAYIRHRTDLGRSPRTVEREAAKLASLWRWGAQRGWLPAPLVSFAKMPPPTPTAWSRSEVHALLKAAKEYESYFGYSQLRKSKYPFSRQMPANIIMVAFLRLLLDTAERFTASRRVLWSDIDLSRRTVVFRAETRKGGNRAQDNIQRFGRKTARALRHLRKEQIRRKRFEPDGPVFPQVHNGTWYYHYKNVVRAAGLPCRRDCSFHKLRRTHATHLYVVGGDATLSLGHHSDQMTRDYYLDPRFVRTEFGADLLNGTLLAMVRRIGRRMKAVFGYW